MNDSSAVSIDTITIDTVMSEHKPVIGITTYLEQAQTGVWDVRAAFLPEVYVKAVTESGGIAVALPPQALTADQTLDLIDSLDGVIVAGGADINPALYGQEAGPNTGEPRNDRDSFELQLTLAAIKTGTPFLGICRGAQMLNISLGGTLIQHLPDVVGDKRYQVAPGEFTRMEVEVKENSKLGAILGDKRIINAHLYHHQAIDRPADMLTVTSRTADNVIESVEMRNHPFCIAVQWHPEENAADRRIFKALVKAAAEHASMQLNPTA